MYATLSYDINAGSEPIEDVRDAVLKALGNTRERCDVLSDTLICEIDDAGDYEDLVDSLREVGTEFSGQFQFVITLHEAKSPLRSNGKFVRADAKAIIG
ncbi:MAG TPA: hypothetical protein VN700_14860 [Vicinamibacterales bacterium]|nr:hypothetical protein [Vicinamibacterales bacterium]